MTKNYLDVLDIVSKIKIIPKSWHVEPTIDARNEDIYVFTVQENDGTKILSTTIGSIKKQHENRYYIGLEPICADYGGVPGSYVGELINDKWESRKV